MSLGSSFELLIVGRQMDQKAIEHASRHMFAAAASLSTMKDSNDFQNIEANWTQFLGLAGKVFSKLEQGAKCSTSSKAWFGRVIGLRRSDPLLRYVWHARNAEEHTLQDVVSLNPGYAQWNPPTEAEAEKLRLALKDEPRPYCFLGVVEGVLPHPKLQPVTDRGQTYLPPTEHLGCPLENTSPAAVGDLLLSYLANLLDEARKLAT